MACRKVSDMEKEQKKYRCDYCFKYYPESEMEEIKGKVYELSESSTFTGEYSLCEHCSNEILCGKRKFKPYKEEVKLD
jgi:Pyruvate/2-oxoacid:ferredoxin oxidoreductase delta subunit